MVVILEGLLTCDLDSFGNRIIIVGWSNKKIKLREREMWEGLPNEWGNSMFFVNKLMTIKLRTLDSNFQHANICH